MPSIGCFLLSLDELYPVPIRVIVENVSHENNFHFLRIDYLISDCEVLCNRVHFESEVNGIRLENEGILTLA